MGVDTPAWVRDAVFYQVFPDRFAASSRVPKPGALEPWDAPPTPHGFKGGDLLGIVEHLDELRELGVTALYMTPIFSSASNHRYHAYDYLSVDPLLGGDAALRELLDQAHARGMRVVLDGVFNHCGRGFWPFHHVAESGSASPYRGWFHLSREVLDGTRGLRPYPTAEEIAEQRRLEAHGIPAGEASKRVLGYEGWWGLPALPKLATDHPATRAYLLAVAEHWLRFGIDGWRLDVAEEIDGEYWAEFRQRCKAVNPDAYLVAEIWRPKPEWLTGRQFDALMNYPLAEAIIGFTGGPSLDRAVLREHDEYEAWIVPRDAASFGAELGRLAALVDPAVAAVQLNLLGSHDAPRLRTVMGGDLDAVRLATLLQLTLPGAPSIYYGDEIAMEGHQDPDNRRAYPWQAVTPEGVELRSFVARLLGLRHGSRALRDGGLRVAAAQGNAVALLRDHGPDAFVVAANAGTETTTLGLQVPEPTGSPSVVALPGWPEEMVGVERTTPGSVSVTLPPRTGAIVRLEGPDD
jgi:neopullulanase